MVIDIICVIFAGYGFYLGFSKGIIQTVFTVVSVLFGVMAAARFSPQVTDFLQSAFSYEHALMFIAGILLTFVGTMVIIRLLAASIESVLESANINIINQVIGGIVMTVLMVGLYSVLVLFAEKAHVIDKATQDTSYTYPMLEALPEQMDFASKKIKPILEDFWDYSILFMDKIEREVEKNESDSIFDVEEKEDDKKDENAPRRRR